MTKTQIEIPSTIKGLIFDLDGTIADTMPAHFIAWRNAVEPYGIDFTVELFNKLAGIPLYKTIEKLNEMFNTNMNPQEVGDRKETEFVKTLEQTKPIEPVVEVIKAYHGKLPMSVGTGGIDRIAWRTLQIVGLDKYFDILVASDHISNSKPHPETFLKCAEQMGVAPEDCLVFEDGVLGIQAAEAGGMSYVDVTKYYEVTMGK
ncbi:beta-phosphoglucomutase family hydrolase [Puteibacter caeruleilacunae]|nr:beta-phosphoglucomutase family hydrolase [Puteibacter caeruleilacunae]